MAWRAAGHTVIGYARRDETRRRARELGTADSTPESLAEAARADVVVLATPVLAMRRLFTELGPHLPPGTIVTDAASTKVDVERWATQTLPPEVRFVGGHPMAGKETAGIDHADGSLFRGRTWCIVPPPHADPAAVETVTRLAADTGASAVRLDAATHDRAVAATSHLPFMASAALCLSVVTRPEFAQMVPVAGTGLRDTTRLASGDAVMHRDICLTNRDNLARELEAYAAHVADLAALVRRLPAPDSADRHLAVADLEHLFVRLKETRDGWLHGQWVAQSLATSEHDGG